MTTFKPLMFNKDEEVLKKGKKHQAGGKRSQAQPGLQMETFSQHIQAPAAAAAAAAQGIEFGR